MPALRGDQHRAGGGGALRVWDGRRYRKGKLRLITDARALNIWQTYLPFSFERLADLPQYLEQDDLLVVLDAKSGYHHIGVAPEHRRYLCVHFEGVTFRFNVLPFGVAQEKQIPNLSV